MNLPIFTISYLTHPNVADNIFDAQMDGAPKVLTYNGASPLLRRAAMRFDSGGLTGKVPVLKPGASGVTTDRDEYPFACTYEGGSASRIAHVPSGENRSAGGLMAAFFNQHGVKKGACFRVQVLHHKRGAVIRPCRLKCRGCASLCH